MFGLTSYVKSTTAARPEVSLADYIKQLSITDPVLLVDGDALVFWLAEAAVAPTVEAPFPSLFGGDYSALRLLTLAVVRDFTEAGVRLQCFFDGYDGPGDAKEDTKRSRLVDAFHRIVEVDDYLLTGKAPQSSGGGGGRKNAVAPIVPASASASDADTASAARLAAVQGAIKVRAPGAGSQVVASLLEAGVACASVCGEADPHLARLAAADPAHVLAVLSQDSDYLCFPFPAPGVRYLPLDRLRLPSLPRRDLRAPVASGLVLTAADVAATLQLQPRYMPDLAICAGNDYTKPLLYASGGEFNNPTPSPSGSRLHAMLNGRNTRLADVAQWLASTLCSCDSPSIVAASNVAHTMCSVCERPVRVEDVESFAALLDDDPALADAVDTSRATYGMAPCQLTEELIVAAAEVHVGMRPAPEVQEMDDLGSFQRRLYSDVRLAGFYAANMLKELPVTLRLLEVCAHPVKVAPIIKVCFAGKDIHFYGSPRNASLFTSTSVVCCLDPPSTRCAVSADAPRATVGRTSLPSGVDGVSSCTLPLPRGRESSLLCRPRGGWLRGRASRDHRGARAGASSSTGVSR